MDEFIVALYNAESREIDEELDLKTDESSVNYVEVSDDLSKPVSITTDNTFDINAAPAATLEALKSAIFVKYQAAAEEEAKQEEALEALQLDDEDDDENEGGKETNKEDMESPEEDEEDNLPLESELDIESTLENDIELQSDASENELENGEENESEYQEEEISDESGMEFELLESSEPEIDVQESEEEEGEEGGVAALGEGEGEDFEDLESDEYSEEEFGLWGNEEGPGDVLTHTESERDYTATETESDSELEEEEEYKKEKEREKDSALQCAEELEEEKMLSNRDKTVKERMLDVLREKNLLPGVRRPIDVDEGLKLANLYLDHFMSKFNAWKIARRFKGEDNVKYPILTEAEVLAQYPVEPNRQPVESDSEFNIQFPTPKFARSYYEAVEVGSYSPSPLSLSFFLSSTPPFFPPSFLLPLSPYYFEYLQVVSGR